MLSENQTLLDSLPTPRQINQGHREFWRKQSRLRTKRLSDLAMRELANRDMQSETFRQVPLRSRKNLEQALADAEWRLKFVRRDLSRKGGKTPKHDALQDLTETIHCACHSITPGGLLRELTRHIGQGVIEKIEAADETLSDEGPQIHYLGEDGKRKTASVSGLKDRLLRLRKVRKVRKAKKASR